MNTHKMYCTEADMKLDPVRLCRQEFEQGIHAGRPIKAARYGRDSDGPYVVAEFGPDEQPKPRKRRGGTSKQKAPSLSPEVPHGKS